MHFEVKHIEYSALSQYQTILSYVIRCRKYNVFQFKLDYRRIPNSTTIYFKELFERLKSVQEGTNWRYSCLYKYCKVLHRETVARNLKKSGIRLVFIIVRTARLSPVHDKTIGFWRTGKRSGGLTLYSIILALLILIWEDIKRTLWRGRSGMRPKITEESSFSPSLNKSEVTIISSIKSGKQYLITMEYGRRGSWRTHY